jgi:hypothetical protein
MRRIVASLVCLAFVGIGLPLQADASTSVRAASMTLTPTPMAAQGALMPGQSVTLTLSAFTSSGAPAPYASASIWLDTYRPDGHWVRNFQIGQFTVNSPVIACHPVVCVYRLNAQGQLTMTYTAGTPPPPNGPRGDAWVVQARVSSSSVGLLSSEYTYATTP